MAGQIHLRVPKSARATATILRVRRPLTLLASSQRKPLERGGGQEGMEFQTFRCLEIRGAGIITTQPSPLPIIVVPGPIPCTRQEVITRETAPEDSHHLLAPPVQGVERKKVNSRTDNFRLCPQIKGAGQWATSRWTCALRSWISQVSSPLFWWLRRWPVHVRSWSRFLFSTAPQFLFISRAAFSLSIVFLLSGFFSAFLNRCAAQIWRVAARRGAFPLLYRTCWHRQDDAGCAGGVAKIGNGQGESKDKQKTSKIVALRNFLIRPPPPHRCANWSSCDQQSRLEKISASYRAIRSLKSGALLFFLLYPVQLICQALLCFGLGMIDETNFWKRNYFSFIDVEEVEEGKKR